jgi:hypothetical protein
MLNKSGNVFNRKEICPENKPILFYGTINKQYQERSLFTMARISKSQLVKLQKQLKTDAAIGEKFEITRQAVHQLRKKYGIESVIAKNAERNKKIVVAYKGGASGTTLAKKFDLSISQTYRIINEIQGSKKKAKAKK